MRSAQENMFFRYRRHCNIYLLIFQSEHFYLLFECVQSYCCTSSRSTTHTNSVGLLWMSDRPFAETSTWQHIPFTTERAPRLRLDSNPQSQEPNGLGPIPYTDGHQNQLSYFYEHETWLIFNSHRQHTMFPYRIRKRNENFVKRHLSLRST